jgi:predicted ATPase
MWKGNHMPQQHLLRSLRLKNFLSFGEEGVEVELGALNVLIGPNASGKSNLIEALSLLRWSPRDLTVPIHEGGGIGDWLWKGSKSQNNVALIEAVVNHPQGIMPLRYCLSFGAVNQRLNVADEVVENWEPTSANEMDVYFFYRYQGGRPVINARIKPDAQAGTHKGRKRRLISPEDISPIQSVLSQRRDPDQYPEITYLGNEFGRMHLYRDWNLGRNSPPRMPQKADLPGDMLQEDANNLGLVLNNLLNLPATKKELIQRFRRFYPSVEEITTKVHGGTVQVFLHETGMHQPIPATRLSDGTLRYLCLLTILCHPTPPPVVCIEEPELGLHPDVIPIVAELMIEASERTQLFVTTHSDDLVTALTDTPEAVLVCERDAGGTKIKRLNSEQLTTWLKDYTLGELWRMGEIGGTKQ